MSTTITEVPEALPDSGPTASRGRWQPWALAAICLLATVLYSWAIGSGRWGNTYYSAAIRSMSGGFRDFLFGSFDPAGVITLDKSPMGQWPQVLAVGLFGYHAWALLLPQVIEGVLAVLVLHRAVRRWAGEHAGLLAALVLALTPITVAVDRDNNPDTLLVLFVVAAAYALTRSVGAGVARSATRWLLLCAFLIGCGFLTKMLQAWMVVPGFAVAYFAGARTPVRRRLLDLLGAAVVLVVSSGWWVALVDLWPGDKPYIGGSTDGTAWQLLLGYNGFSRIVGGDASLPGGGLPAGMALPPGVHLPPGGLLAIFGGDPGLGRLFAPLAGGQVSWLLPLALLCLLAAAVAGLRARLSGVPADRPALAGWLLWGSWLVVTGVLFSDAQGVWHPYYTTFLAPPLAAVVAAGVAGLWRAAGPAKAVLALGFLGTGGWAWVLVGRDPDYFGWTRWAALTGAVVAAAGLLAGRRVTRPALALGLAAALLTPAVWSVAQATSGLDDGQLPAAGPANGATPGTVALSAREQKILGYARAHGAAMITLVVDGSAMLTAPYLITTADAVVGTGGFLGTDDVPKPSTLEQWAADGTMRYVLSYLAPGDPGPTAAQRARAAWFGAHCATVPPADYGATQEDAAAPSSSFTGLVGGQRLLDCHA